MQRRDNLAHLILASVVVLLMVVVEAQAQIAFVSTRDGNWQIYVMDADGANPQNLTNNRYADSGPAWFNSPFSVSPAGKKFTI